MNKNVKVNIFLAILTAVAIIIAIFALSRSNSESSCPIKDFDNYEENMKALNDTIKELKSDIARYKERIDQIDLEREHIKEELKVIIKDNEKVDTELANGDWDTNIKFLTDFLSEEDSLGK